MEKTKSSRCTLQGKKSPAFTKKLARPSSQEPLSQLYHENLAHLTVVFTLLSPGGGSKIDKKKSSIFFVRKIPKVSNNKGYLKSKVFCPNPTHWMTLKQK